VPSRARRRGRDHHPHPEAGLLFEPRSPTLGPPPEVALRRACGPRDAERAWGAAAPWAVGLSSTCQLRGPSTSARGACLSPKTVSTGLSPDELRSVAPRGARSNPFCRHDHRRHGAGAASVWRHRRHGAGEGRRVGCPCCQDGSLFGPRSLSVNAGAARIDFLNGADAPSVGHHHRSDLGEPCVSNHHHFGVDEVLQRELRPGCPASSAFPRSRYEIGHDPGPNSPDLGGQRSYQGVHPSKHPEIGGGLPRCAPCCGRHLLYPGARSSGLHQLRGARFGDRQVCEDAPMLRPWAPDECTDPGWDAPHRRLRSKTGPNKTARGLQVSISARMVAKR
jgi:hypothetical protein